MNGTPLDGSSPPVQDTSKPHPDRSWMNDAECAGTDPTLFFPERDNGMTVLERRVERRRRLRNGAA